ncbi:2-hydroxychromene-2-carboxylate isomerase [Marinibaculum pumilum]|uniref:2-hydroxychromene-2-carboxylate isomerase n=1 Tax=Marinibaculum pumilum TaxID=1766165 RepID=A0ABV7L6N3_9PROT
MTLEVDLYWSFRSPYCYLAGDRLAALEREHDLRLSVRPVLPIAVRIPGFFKTVNPLRVPYNRMDAERVAASLQVPFHWPRPDPIVMDVATGEVPADQPYIHRLTRLGALAAEQGRGLPFVRAVAALLFGAGIDGWDRGAHLARAVAGAGLDLAEMEAAVADDAGRLDAAIAANEAAQTAAGHWGVPLMVFRGEPFFGQDRIDLLLWRLRQAGLRAR